MIFIKGIFEVAFRDFTFDRCGQSKSWLRTDDALIFVVSAYPEPCNHVGGIVTKAERPVVSAYVGRINRLYGVNTSEMKPGW